MPIGTVDYVSTAPWNDPLNPWPQYAQVLLSGTVITDGDKEISFSNKVLTLTIMNPYAVYPQQHVLYQGVYQNPGTAVNSTIDLYNSTIYLSNSWTLNIVDNPVGAPGTSSGYTAINPQTAQKDVPYIYTAGQTNGWFNYNGTGINSVTLVPVTTNLNPWEHRRRRLLEII
jgi:hypothetical protein